MLASARGVVQAAPFVDEHPTHRSDVENAELDAQVIFLFLPQESLSFVSWTRINPRRPFLVTAP